MKYRFFKIVIDLFIFFILITSFLGIVVILYRKIPIIADFSSEKNKNEKGLMLKIKEEIKNNISVKAITSGENLLLKFLSKCRIIFLKAEYKISCWLSILRQKTKEKSIKCKKTLPDNYWNKIKIRRKRKSFKNNSPK